MMHSFKTSSSIELIELIEKHGADDAIDIVSLMRLMNKPLHEIISGLSTKDEGLNRPQYEVLKFWASQLGTGALEFFTTHVHTIIAGDDRYCSEHGM
ncbi:hypothetical protein NW768_007328 [Fusarium equiseti]|uniref:Death domain-containing protein n=1 Tax=Fusarium equiseti TaxID=61235 RepID=A0ABQ8R758_FUSEQ|nr:hypothetical protein NW768_007328 [Fusarium equiseti]